MSRPTDDLMTLADRALTRALAARERAYAPYSGFRVGAAVVDADGTVYSGANVENASYGLTVCAERMAVWTATLAGAPHVRLVLVVADAPEPVTPCGACRQVLVELAPDAVVVMASVDGRRRACTVRDLLPDAFTKAALPAPSP